MSLLSYGFETDKHDIDLSESTGTGLKTKSPKFAPTHKTDGDDNDNEILTPTFKMQTKTKQFENTTKIGNEAINNSQCTTQQEHNGQTSTNNKNDDMTITNEKDKKGYEDDNTIINNNNNNSNIWITPTPITTNIYPKQKIKI